MNNYLQIRNYLVVFCLLFSIDLFGQEALEKLPTIAYIHSWTDEGLILEKALPKTGRVLFVFYDPGCGSCQELGSGISKSGDLLKNTQIYFISMHDNDLVEGYINMHAKGLLAMKNVSFWKDPGTEFMEKFRPKNYPATYFFDAKTKKLIKDFQGESKLNKMLPALN